MGRCAPADLREPRGLRNPYLRAPGSATDAARREARGGVRAGPDTGHVAPAPGLVLAVLFYAWWGFSFGVWIDNGVYAVVITLLLFGLAGMWLMMPNPPAPAP